MDRCPKCGALYKVKHHDYDEFDGSRLLRTGREYGCASVFYSNGFEVESPTCLHRQLAAANERAELAEDFVRVCRTAVGELDDSPKSFYETIAVAIMDYDAEHAGRGERCGNW